MSFLYLILFKTNRLKKKSNFLESNVNNNKKDFMLDTIFTSRIMVHLDMVYLLLKFSSSHSSGN